MLLLWAGSLEFLITRLPRQVSEGTPFGPKCCRVRSHLPCEPRCSGSLWSAGYYSACIKIARWVVSRVCCLIAGQREKLEFSCSEFFRLSCGTPVTSSSPWPWPDWHIIRRLLAYSLWYYILYFLLLRWKFFSHEDYLVDLFWCLVVWIKLRHGGWTFPTPSLKCSFSIMIIVWASSCLPEPSLS